eukprot:5111331-Pleurochrysis_carterae.AAC.3
MRACTGQARQSDAGKARTRSMSPSWRPCNGRRRHGHTACPAGRSSVTCARCFKTQSCSRNFFQRSALLRCGLLEFPPASTEHMHFLKYSSVQMPGGSDGVAVQRASMLPDTLVGALVTD